MSKPIQIGDMVCVVRYPCCGACLGVVTRVTDFYTNAAHADMSISYSWLIRIDPPAQDESDH